ncbi:UDP-glucose 4-epimerase GalE [Joostella sp. CR20]|uniref:UDP-glucose 4-epimerase GalE n=1 Tax=Joostella sp. CR20 TaxID=2804312 RepID=UPI00313C2301
MKILVTGGLGYIGSHTVVELQNKGYEVIIVDNLSNSSIEVLDNIEKITGKKPAFEKVDLREKDTVSAFFKKYTDIAGVIHFAASIFVNESVENPLLYYENNLNSLIYLLKEVSAKKEMAMIFSSSCTVYGQADELPITEEAPVKKAEAPYGNTKQIGEEIIADTCKVTPNLKAISLRYFNPVGGHETALIGETPQGKPHHLVPYITQTAIGIREQLTVFGGDYPTKDGTCIRDYIHVVDLGKAHVTALERLLNNKNETNYEVFNIGTGTGSSVFEVIGSFERISGEKLNFKVADRRPGDVAAIYADTKKANEVLGWEAKSTLDEAMASAWKWEKKVRGK